MSMLLFVTKVTAYYSHDKTRRQEKELHTIILYIQKSIFPTSDSFRLIESHMCGRQIGFATVRFILQCVQFAKGNHIFSFIASQLLFSRLTVWLETQHIMKKNHQITHFVSLPRLCQYYRYNNWPGSLKVGVQIFFHIGFSTLQ